MVLRIKVMHDYRCYPLWVLRDDEDLPADESPSDLGVSTSLAGRFEAWRLWGESRLNFADPHDSRVVSRQEDEAFDEEGRRLTRRLAAELPGAVVWYHDDGPLPSSEPG
jgi:hypothetical protein